jgi:hypothetical protein
MKEGELKLGAGENWTIQNTVAARVESSVPQAYRLRLAPDGTLTLQGCFWWNEGFKFGHEWRDIPTVTE